MTKNISQPITIGIRIGIRIGVATLAILCAQNSANADQVSNATPVIQASNDREVLPLAPYQYVPSPRWKEPDAEQAAEIANRSPAQQKIAELYSQSNYTEAGALGYELLKKEKIDDQLQLSIANSLGWTGRSKEAGQLYRVLIDSKYKSEATLGLANLHRWGGRDHLALPMYKEILAKEPDNKDAKEGLRLATRETQPRTTIILGGLNDSGKVNIRSLKINHRWADETLANIWEIETGTLQSKDAVVSVSRPTLTVRYKAQETFLKPRLEAGSDGKNLYGNVGISVGELPVLLDVGKVNWGDLSSNPKALAAQLTATRISAQTSATFAAGNVFARAEVNKISDGNTIVATALRFTPAWRPLGSHFKPVIGIETRDSKLSKLEYWSPSTGYGTAFAGISAEWQDSDWNFFASAQAGTRLYGEAGNSWSTAMGGKYWLTKQWSIGMRLWAMSSQRNFQSYRAQSAFVTVEKLWD
jgi:hypothetical protein